MPDGAVPVPPPNIDVPLVVPPPKIEPPLVPNPVLPLCPKRDPPGCPNVDLLPKPPVVPPPRNDEPVADGCPKRDVVGDEVCPNMDWVVVVGPWPNTEGVVVVAAACPKMLVLAAVVAAGCPNTFPPL